MAFRGRGRGRGGFRGGGGFGFAKEAAFILFPDIEVPDRKNVTEESELISWNRKLQQFRSNSRYFLEEANSERTESRDIERYSDRLKSLQGNKTKRGLLSDVMKLEPGYFPLELVEGLKPSKRRKVKWNADSGLDKLDLFEKLEEKLNDQDPKSKKEDEEDDDVDEDVEEEEDLSDGDYGQNEDFDDDDDDFNMDEGDDEPDYE